MAFESLPLSRVRKASKLLRSQGLKLPKHGRCVTAGYVKEYGSSTRVEVCRDNRGYYVLPASRGAQGLFGTSIARVQKRWQVRGRRADGKKLAFPVMAFDIFEAGRTAEKRARGGRIEDIVLIEPRRRR